jgi:hypothetical protein
VNTVTRTIRPLRQQIVRLSVSLGLAASLAGGFAVPAFAADLVTQEITAGTRSASVADLAFSNVAYSHVSQTPTGSMTLTANDSTGSGAGWNVTILSSFFNRTGSVVEEDALDIPAANFSLTSAALPAMTAGQAVNVTGGNGPEASAASGTLDSAKKVILAGIGYGQGTYTQALGVSLVIPAQARAGTYTGTLVTTISAAP